MLTGQPHSSWLTMTMAEREALYDLAVKVAEARLRKGERRGR